jgi:hypothetical protein
MERGKRISFPRALTREMMGFDRPLTALSPIATLETGAEQQLSSFLLHHKKLNIHQA